MFICADILLLVTDYSGDEMLKMVLGASLRVDRNVVLIYCKRKWDLTDPFYSIFAVSRLPYNCLAVFTKLTPCVPNLHFLQCSSYDIATANGKGGKEIRAPEIIGLRLNQRLKLKLQQPTDAF